MEITNNDGKFEAPRENILFFVIGVVAAISFSIVLLVYRSLMSDDVLMIPVILLNIISLVTFLFRPRKLITFWISFILTLLAFNAVTYITGKFYSYLLFSSTLVSMFLLLPLSLYFAKTSTKTSLPSATDQINIEQLGSLYSWTFFAQIMFLTLLTYGSEADIKIKGPSLLVTIILYSIMIYGFDQRARSGVQSSASGFKTMGINKIFEKILKVLLKVLSKIASVLLNILRLKYGLDDFIKLIERSLHKIKCFTKPVIEDLGSAVLLGSLVSLPLATVILAFYSLSDLDKLMIGVAISATAIIFVLSIGIKLRRKCHVDLMIGVLSFRFSTIIGVAFVIIATVLALVNILPKQLLIPMLVFILALLVSLAFTVIFILSLAAIVAIAMIHGHLSQILTSPTDPAGEMATKNLILTSVTIFTMFIAFSLISCLRHEVRCSEE